MAAKKWAYVADLGGGAGAVHNGDPATDYIENHVHYRDFNGRNRILVGQGDPGTQLAPSPLILPEETFFGRQVGGALSALGPHQVGPILGYVRSATQPAASAWDVIQLWEHSDDTTDDEELFYYDRSRSKWLSVAPRYLTFQDPSLSATGYIDFCGGLVSSAGFGYKLLGSWTVVGVEMNQSPSTSTITVRLNMTGTALSGSAQTITAVAGSVNNTLNVDVTTNNPILGCECTATSGSSGQLFNVTWKLRRRPSA